MDKIIYFAGGCFWGVQAYFDKIKGVKETFAGYANGPTENPSYEEVCSASGHVETVKIIYNTISLNELLEHLFRIIDPTSINKQGGDMGLQYRTGVYYEDEDDLKIIENFIAEKQKQLAKKIAVEIKKLENFYLAEEYHQKYLEKNPGGYCHIDLGLTEKPVVMQAEYKKPNEEELKKNLSEISYRVTQENATESPFENEYDKHYEKGIYVDIVTGEPLFISTDKFDSGCGWPAFSKPIIEEVVNYYKDDSHGMKRVEVRSRSGNSHLGHIFPDGPKESGGSRYCINSAALKFIPLKEMKDKGYEKWIEFVK